MSAGGGGKPVHRAKHLGPSGQVSPLCAKTLRALDLTRATWTLRDDAVTCPRCLAALAAAPARGGTET